MWIDEADAEERLAAKLQSDLVDMADLKAAILDAAAAAPVAREADA